MSENPEKPHRLIRVGAPMTRVRLRMKPCVPVEGPITPGPLITVGAPMTTVKLKMKPVPPPVLVLQCSVEAGVTAETVLAKLVPLLELVKGLGFSWDRGQSKGEPGRITIHLVPMSPQAAERLPWLAEHLRPVLATITAVTKPTLTEVPALKV